MVKHLSHVLIQIWDRDSTTNTQVTYNYRRRRRLHENKEDGMEV